MLLLDFQMCCCCCCCCKRQLLPVQHACMPSCSQAVRCAVNLMEPEATVYEVKHCAQAVLQYDPILGGFDNNKNSQPHAHPLHERLRQWRLACKSGETGVSWFV
jgi:hypothetical protein